MHSIYYERNRNKVFLIYLAITLLLLFQDILQQYIKGFKWTDELVGVGLIPLTFILVIAKQIKFYKEEKIIIISFAIFIVLGLLSSYINKYQSINVTIYDMVIVSKFLGAYFFSRVFFYEINIREYYKYIKTVFRLITLVLFAVTVIDMVLGIYPKGDKRLLINSEKLLFFHPTYLAVFCIVVLAYLTLVSEDKVIDYVFIIQAMLVCASTFRSKAIGLLIIYIIFLYLAKRRIKLKASFVILAVLVMLIIFMPQIKFYYLDDTDSPRSVLTMTGLKIYSRFFPVGSGFGTFGSYISGVNYSPLYNEYRISSIWGLEKGNSFFISDTFWPMIMGQFGFLGLLVFCIILLNFFILIFKLNEFNIYNMLLALIPFTYLMIASTSESSFVNYYSVNFFIMTGMAVNQIKVYREQKNLLWRS